MGGTKDGTHLNCQNEEGKVQIDATRTKIVILISIQKKFSGTKDKFTLCCLYLSLMDNKVDAFLFNCKSSMA